MVYTGNIVQNRVGTVYKTQLVTMVTEPVWMAVMLVIKGNTAQHVGLIVFFKNDNFSYQFIILNLKH